jgi:hypothetical protein
MSWAAVQSEVARGVVSRHYLLLMALTHSMRLVTKKINGTRMTPYRAIQSSAIWTSSHGKLVAG